MLRAYRANVVILISDLLIALFAFWLSRYFGDLPRWYWLVLSSLIWVVVGVGTRKLYFNEYKRYTTFFTGLLIVNSLCGFSLFSAYRIWVADYQYDYSILIATIIISLLECLLYYAIRLFVYRKIPYFYEAQTFVENESTDLLPDDEKIPNKDLLNLFQCFNEGNTEVLFSKDNLLDNTTVVTNTSDPESVLQYNTNQPTLVLHSLSLNNVRHINTLLANTNDILSPGGYVVCNCITSDVVHNRIFAQSPRFIAEIIYAFNYFIHRVLSKLTITRRLYYLITRGERRVLTRVETLGRFYRAGYDVIHEHTINDKFYIVAKKIKEPIRDDKPSNGLLIRLKRKGRNGKIIGVYKFRTMHAYSEYLQPYMFKTEGLTEDGCRYGNDYRVSAVGAIMRKFFIDELPMLINWLKRDLKLVGVRPLSEHYFSLYTKEFQELRLMVKPGLIPPFYVDKPNTIEEKQESERRYIESYLENPTLTDWRYFWRIFYSIVFKGTRSE